MSDSHAVKALNLATVPELGVAMRNLKGEHRCEIFGETNKLGVVMRHLKGEHRMGQNRV